MQMKQLFAHQFYVKEIENLENPKPVIIYGAGKEGKKVLAALRQAFVPVAFFVDRDEQKSRQNIAGVPIITPELFVNMKMEVFNLVLAIVSPAYPVEQILSDLFRSIYAPLGIAADEAAIYELKEQLPLIATYSFASRDEYFNADHWFWPLCYDRVENFSYDYVKELHALLPTWQLRNGLTMFSDKQSRYVNYKGGGERLTYYTPSHKAENHIYFIGDSRAAGVDVEDRHTIASYLQKLVSNLYFVVNYGCRMFAISTFYEQLKTLTLKKNDVVIFSSCLHFVDFSDKEDSVLEKDPLVLFSFYLKKMRDFCVKCGSSFYYLDIPQVDRIINPSLVEQYFYQSAIDQIVPLCMKPIVAFRRALHFDIEKFYTVLDAWAIPYIDMSKKFSRPHPYGETYVDRGHLSPNGNKVVADVIFEKINALSALWDTEDLESACDRHYGRFLNVLSKSYDGSDFEGYSNYLKQFRIQKPTEAGCIVMNCNPFTIGHQYLIECAASQVGWLYIFVVQEDQSQFPFQDRFRLVQEGIRDLHNVTVLKSGDFIISTFTLPEYFTKDAVQSSKINCFDDVFIFSAKIAPILHITKRFAGTEPFCAITKQYNQQMKDMLPRYGIEFIEIPRLRQGEEEISASEVRRLLEEQDYDSIKNLVPETTYAYLRNLKN